MKLVAEERNAPASPARWSQTFEFEGSFWVAMGLEAREKEVLEIGEIAEARDFADRLSADPALLSTFHRRLQTQGVKASVGLLRLDGYSIHASAFGGVKLDVQRGERKAVLLNLPKAPIVISGTVAPGDIYRLSVHGGGSEIILRAIDVSAPPTAPVVGGAKGAKARLVGILDKLIEIVPQRRDTSPEEKGYKKRKNRAAAPLAGFLLLLILGVSIFFGIREKNRKEFRQSYQPQMVEARESLHEAESLSGLDRARSRELLLNAKKIIDNLTERGIEDAEIMALAAEITRSLEAVGGIYQEEPDLFLDVSILSQGLKVDELSLSDGVIRVLDSDKQRLLTIDVGTKKTSVVAGKDKLFGAFDVTSYVDRSFTLSRDGIREVGNEVVLQVKADEWAADKAEIGAFAGNLYVLSRENDSILRYNGIPSGFTEAHEWLAEGTNVSFAGVTSMAIDGSIWVLWNDGEILKFTRGSPSRFAASVSSNPLESPLELFTDEDQEGVYILEPAKSRIVVFSKEGELLGEYTNDKISTANALVADEAERKIIFSAGPVLYSFDMKHF